MAAFPRRTGIASAGTLATLAVAVGLAHLLAPGWCRAAGLDVWNYRQAEADYRRHADRADELCDYGRRLKAQLAVSDRLIDDLAGGRLSVAEAADELAEVNRDRGGFEDGLKLAYPGVPGHRLRVARHAIEKARHRLPGDGREQARERLEAEYLALSGE